MLTRQRPNGWTAQDDYLAQSDATLIQAWWWLVATHAKTP